VRCLRIHESSGRGSHACSVLLLACLPASALSVFRPGTTVASCPAALSQYLITPSAFSLEPSAVCQRSLQAGDRAPRLAPGCTHDRFSHAPCWRTGAAAAADGAALPARPARGWCEWATACCLKW
jgi:hypothetical protein